MDGLAKRQIDGQTNEQDAWCGLLVLSHKIKLLSKTQQSKHIQD